MATLHDKKDLMVIRWNILYHNDIASTIPMFEHSYTSFLSNFEIANLLSRDRRIHVSNLTNKFNVTKAEVFRGRTSHSKAVEISVSQMQYFSSEKTLPLLYAGILCEGKLILESRDNRNVIPTFNKNDK